LVTSSGASQPNNAGNTNAYVVKLAAGLPSPVINNVSDPNGVVPNGITRSSSLTLRGTAPPSSRVQLYQGAAFFDYFDVDLTGNWSYALNLPNEGVYSFTALSISGRQTSGFSNPFSVTVDRTPPSVRLTAQAHTFSFSPRVQVRATDLVGMPDSATVAVA